MPSPRRRGFPAVIPLVGMSFAGLACTDLSHLATGGPDASLGDAATPLPEEGGAIEGGVAPCGSNEKRCDGVCVSKDNPAYGCAADACTPCSVPYANDVTCRAGECGAATCQTGRADCNNRGMDGCEADLGTPATCGNCTTACPSNLVCVPGSGCLSGCPGTLVNCDGACVDLATSPSHCGTCSNACAGAPNAVPSCAASGCTLTCNSGYDQCDGDGTNGCEAKLPYYTDGDADGYGTTLAGSACTPPPGNAPNGGDCLDTNAKVYPGNKTFFATGYTMGATKTSYDYDCNGVEEEASQSHGTCASPCSYGYVPGTRTPGPGVSMYCGSVTAVSYCSSGSASGSAACSTSSSNALGCR